ncbi:MAG: murein L,D-transpeptidase catalytic domain-containing protein [Pontixanthobacter sp.]
MNRRDLIKTSLIAGGSLTAALQLPARLAAQPRTGLPRDAKLIEIAKRAQDQVRARGMLWHEDYVGIADFGLRSSEPRFHSVNLQSGMVKSYYVTHGDGSDPEHDGWLNWFSNVHGSHCTSEGTYATFGWYTGRFGTSIRLEGLDETNSNALDRAIVMHRARYAEAAHVRRFGRLGRSNGCFAFGDADFKEVLLNIGGGRAIHAESLGLLPDGTTQPTPTRPAPRDLKILQPDVPEQFQRSNPGVY